MRKDLDEFKKQKFVIGSIIAMPIVLGVVLPLVMFVPMVTMVPLERPWDIDGLLQIGSFPDDAATPWTNQTIEDATFDATIFRHTILKNASLTDCIIESCVIENTTVVDSTIKNSSLSSSYLSNVTLIRSEGTRLDGRFILAVSSDLTFTRTKPSEIDQVLPMMFNMILMIFIIVPSDASDNHSYL